jgi:hypothetical protein
MNIMSLTVKFSDTPFIAAPAGSHTARCCRVIELGLQRSKTFSTIFPKILLAWELPHQLLSDGQPFLITATYYLHLHSRTRLMGLLENWRGQRFTEEEVAHYKKEGFVFKQLLGQPCVITLTHSHNPSYSQPWVDVASIAPLPEGIVCPSPMNSPIYYAFDEHSEAALAAVPERIRNKIRRENKSAEPSPHTHEKDTTTQNRPIF